MILKDNKVYFIDFGLGFVSLKIEDKAVDLHLLKQALESKHYKVFEDCFNSILKGYKKSVNYEDVMERLKKVEKRGRYKRKNE
jgi:Kae1-associated kinase Bud32